jgi:iron complex outermembrane receptor protein
MRTKLFAGVAFAALMIPASALAQSTGSTDFEGETEIVVTGSRADTGQVVIPDVPKTRVTLGSELISRQRPGQTVNEIVNMTPGVSFQNNDATGAAGGTFTIRGFDSTRISQTIDGIPLNDTGNYAIYSNQQQDPETLESISVSLGSTDIDSPTASASGGTINIKTRVPSDEFHVQLSGTYGDYVAKGSGNQPIYRVFGMVDTGDFTGFGTKAFFSASNIEARQPFNNYGMLRKQQYNARIYQEIGGDGDFVAIAGHYNENRNNFFGSVPLRTDVRSAPAATGTTPRITGPNSGNRFPLTREERFYDINYPCTMAIGRPGLADAVAPAPAAPTAGASCGSEFDRRYNPSNTGNIRGNLRLTLADGLIFTVDPSYQYTKANGGGVVAANEGFATLSGGRGTGFTGVLNTGNNPGNTSPSGFGTWAGRDLNGDGDILDTVYITNPSQTQTRRYIVSSSLIYSLAPEHRLKLSYTFDRGRHRQTGEHGRVLGNGEPSDVFPVNDPITQAGGASLQKRDRLSYATLHLVAGEYRGEFGALTVNAGVTGKFFTRDLNQYCFTVAANGNVACVAPTQVAAYTAANPYSYNATTGVVTGFAGPQSRTYKFNRALPSVGLTYDLTSDLAAYASYNKGISVPGTDILYNAFYFPEAAEGAKPKPETTDTFEGGLRYTSGKIQGLLAGWYTNYQNRIASAYDPELDQVITRNLGSVTKWGIDGSLSYQPTRDLLVYVFGSYLKSKIKDDTLLGRNVDIDRNPATPGVDLYYATAGKRESGSPEYTIGGRVQGTLGPIDLGIQAKRTGPRWVNDENLPINQCFNGAGTGGGTIVGLSCFNGSTGTTAGQFVQVYGAKTPSYNIVDLDIRVNLGKLIDGANDRTYFQLNVGNLFDEFYAGGFGGASNRFSVPNVVIGTPRSITGTLVVGF